jgi:uncharacterized protein (DUF58 family)
VSFLRPDVIARLESLALRARVIAEGALNGLHRAHQRGSSVEFAEYKEYSEGDDLRHIDWRVYAKADRYVIKQFEQETELSAHLLLDASGSMTYGGSARRGPRGRAEPDNNEGLSKLEYAAHLLGALAYLLIRQRDKAGLLVFGDRRLERHIPPRARPAHLHDLLAVIEQAMAGGGGDESVAAALERAGELAGRRRGMVVIATDFFDVEQERALAALKHLRARGHDVVLFHLLDPDELGLPFEGLTRFVSLESPRELLASAKAIRRDYLKRLAGFLEGVAEACTDGGIDYVPTPTGRPLEEVVSRFIARRSGVGAPSSRTTRAATAIGDAWTF